MSSLLADEPVSRHMRKAFIQAAPHDSLLEVWETMRMARVRHLPVLDGGALMGLVSYQDVREKSVSHLRGVSAAEGRARLRAIPVAALMHTDVHSVSPQSSLRDAALEMLRSSVGCVPVVAEETTGPKLIGLITESALLAAAYRAHAGPGDREEPLV